MSIEEHKQQVHGVRDSVEAYTQDAHALLQTERFASLPERSRQAVDMAAQLAIHLTGIYEDAKAFGQALQPFADPESERLDNVIGDILELADEADSPEIEALRLTIEQTATSGLRHLGTMLSDHGDSALVYASQLERIAGRTNRHGGYSSGLGRKTAHLTNQMAQSAASLNKGQATVNEVLGNHLEQLEQR